MLDYIIVGLGLAGVSFGELLERNGKSFKVVDDGSQVSSKVAAGMYNPVILKRLTPVWKAKEQLAIAALFYTGLEEKFGAKFRHEAPVYRRFASIGEQNAWFEAMDRKGLQDFLSPKIVENKNPFVHAPFGYGKVLHTGRVDTAKLLSAFKEYLLKKEVLIQERFDFEAFSVQEDYVEYRSVRAKKIVFAEGYGLKQNPFFGYLPLNGTKGELLTLKATDLKESQMIKGPVFLIPLGEDLYRVGATYEREDKTNLPTENAKEELLEKARSFLRCDVEVVEHRAGIRPTVIDRKPLVGAHPRHRNLYVLNGLGSRGVMTAPYASAQLYDYITNGKPIDPEMDSARFTKKYYLSC